MDTSVTHLFRKRALPALETGTKTVARSLSKVPSEAYLAFGLACCGAATGLALSGKTKAAIVLTAWAPTALLVGMYARHKMES
jgi:hypothetical protein